MEAELIKFEIRELPGLCVIGREIIVRMDELEKQNPIPAFWNQCIADGIFDDLQDKLADYIYDPGYVGYMQILNEYEFTNVCGILMKSDAPVPDGYIAYKIGPFTAGVGWVKGKEPDIFIGEHTLTESAAKEVGYRYDEAKGFSLELYDEERYGNIDAEGSRILDYYMPVVKE